MNKKLGSTLLLVSLILTGCADIMMAGMYEPGGELADKHDGTMLLAGATQEKMLALVPSGMLKDKVTELLGKPTSENQSSDGTSMYTYTHSFTSFQQHFATSEYLMITFGADGKVSKTNASANRTNLNF